MPAPPLEPLTWSFALGIGLISPRMLLWMRSFCLAMTLSFVTSFASAMPSGRGHDGGARLPRLLSTARELHPHAQHFSHAPRLSDAPARREGRFGIEDFADRSDAGLVEVRHEPVERTLRAGQIVGVHLQPRIDERSSEPGPRGSLVVGRVTCAEIAEVSRLVFRIAGRERAETDAGEQPIAHDAHHRLPALLDEDGMRQGDGKNLIWPAFRITPAAAVLAVDHVVEVSAVGEPE